MIDEGHGRPALASTATTRAGHRVSTLVTSGSQNGSGQSRGLMRRAWDVATGVIGVVVGLAPHVLHHIALLGGTALVAGSGGTALFGAVGLLASLPLLLRLKRRFASWLAPAIGLSVFAAMFVLSAFVIGPAISGVNDDGSASVPAVEHEDHN